MNKIKIVLVISLVVIVNCREILAVGELDTTFNLTGKVFTSFGHPNTYLHDIAIQPDGKIVAVGDFYNGTNYDIGVVRYNPDGSLDTSFDGDGKVLTAIGAGSDSAKAIAIQLDGRIVVAGSSASSLAFDFALVLDKIILLKEGEFIIVPKGVEHRPVAETEVEVLLFEPAQLLNTGNVVDKEFYGSDW